MTILIKIQEHLMGFLCVANFKQRPQVSGIGGNAIAFENLSGITIGDVVIFDFPGVIRKGDAKAFSASASSASVVIFLRRHSSSAFS